MTQDFRRRVFAGATLIALISLPFFVYAHFFWDDVEVIDLNHADYEIGQGVPQPWELVCLSSQHQNPDFEIRKIGTLGACWDARDVPENKIYVTYVHRDSTCTRKVTTGHFLSDQNSETRCIGADFAGARLSIDTNRIVSLQAQ